jgi:hypothetical protein
MDGMGHADLLLGDGICVDKSFGALSQGKVYGLLKRT